MSASALNLNCVITVTQPRALSTEPAPVQPHLKELQYLLYFQCIVGKCTCVCV